MSEFVIDGEERAAACDKAELLLETTTDAEVIKACEAVLYAYRYDGIMTKSMVDALG